MRFNTEFNLLSDIIIPRVTSIIMHIYIYIYIYI